MLKTRKRYSLSQLVWNMDSLLLHIMLHKRTSGAQEDVQLFESTLDHFAKTGSQNEGKLAADAVAIMYKVVEEAVA